MLLSDVAIYYVVNKVLTRYSRLHGSGKNCIFASSEWSILFAGSSCTTPTKPQTWDHSMNRTSTPDLLITGFLLGCVSSSYIVIIRVVGMAFLYSYDDVNCFHSVFHSFINIVESKYLSDSLLTTYVISLSVVWFGCKGVEGTPSTRLWIGYERLCLKTQELRTQ